MDMAHQSNIAFVSETTQNATRHQRSSKCLSTHLPTNISITIILLIEVRILKDNQRQWLRPIMQVSTIYVLYPNSNSSRLHCVCLRYAARPICNSLYICVDPYKLIASCILLRIASHKDASRRPSSLELKARSPVSDLS